jgi:two-component system sensor histidine kinase KdpD
VERALGNFFTETNLSRLRELTLEELAQALDRRRRKSGEDVPGAASERVMICLASRSPNVGLLLRKGARLADRLNAPWYAVYVQTPRERMDQVDAATQRQVADSLSLAQQLGGVPLSYTGADFASTVAEFVREYGITHVVMGRSHRPWYLRWLQPSALDALLRAVPRVDVLVVTTNQDPTA